MNAATTADAKPLLQFCSSIKDVNQREPIFYRKNKVKYLVVV